MKYNLENSLIAKRNDKDINLLLESTNNINNYMDSLIAILVMKHLPLINNIDEAIKDEKIILIYEDELKNAKVRFVEEKGIVYINVTPFAKKKELTGGKLEYNASTNELYSLLIGAYVTLNHNTLTNDREYVSDMVDIYLEVIPKVFVKGVTFPVVCVNPVVKSPVHPVVVQFADVSNSAPKGADSKAAID